MTFESELGLGLSIGAILYILSIGNGSVRGLLWHSLFSLAQIVVEEIANEIT